MLNTKASNTQGEVLILSSPYVNYYAHPHLKTIELRFTPLSIQCRFENLEEIMTTAAELCNKSGIKQLFFNQEKAYFITDEHASKWLNDTFFPRISSYGITKCIYLFGKHLFNKTSTQRGVNQSSKDILEFYYFEKKETAMNLLLYSRKNFI